MGFLSTGFQGQAVRLRAFTEGGRVKMEEVGDKWAFQVQLNSWSDVFLKQAVDEVTTLINTVFNQFKLRFTDSNLDIVPLVADSFCSPCFQVQLNSCMDALLQRATAEISALVMNIFDRFVSDFSAKDVEIRHLSAKLQILEQKSQNDPEEGREPAQGTSPDFENSPSRNDCTERERMGNLEAEDGLFSVPETGSGSPLDTELVVATGAIEEVAFTVHDYSLQVQRDVEVQEEREASPPPSPPDTPQPALHECRKCGKSFSKEWILRRHMRRHREGGSLETGNVCAHCGRGFKQHSFLVAHLRTHSGEKPYACEACGLRFTHSDYLRKHRRLHSDVRPYVCSQCSRGFYRSDALKNHMRTHLGVRVTVKPYMCTRCGKAFSTAGQVAVHERTHTGERPYQCNQCGKRFWQAGALKAHGITHQSERPHVCPQCPKRFRCTQELKLHQHTHSDARPFSCDQCSKTFRTAKTLKAHNIHHMQQRDHPCPDCGKTFKTKTHVRLHQRMHTEEKPYTCSDCGRAFRRPDHLASHRLTHTGEKPHVCGACQRSFNRPLLLKKHMQQHHTHTQTQTRSHTQEPQLHQPSQLFNCRHCQTGFQQLRQLEAHECPKRQGLQARLKEGALGKRGKRGPVAIRKVQLVKKQLLSVKGVETGARGRIFKGEEPQRVVANRMDRGPVVLVIANGNGPVPSGAVLASVAMPVSAPAVPVAQLPLRVMFTGAAQTTEATTPNSTAHPATKPPLGANASPAVTATQAGQGPLEWLVMTEVPVTTATCAPTVAVPVGSSLTQGAAVLNRPEGATSITAVVPGLPATPTD